MAHVNAVALLNRLFELEYRSLPMYLGWAVPWVSRSEGDEATTLRSIVRDQTSFSTEIGEMIYSLDGVVGKYDFPLVYTGMHDLSIEYLWSKLIEHQEKLIAEIEAIVQAFSAGSSPEARSARALAERVLGSEQAHLEALHGRTPAVESDAEAHHPDPAARFAPTEANPSLHASAYSAHGPDSPRH